MARQLFTARSGGVSTGAFSSLNLANHVGDESSSVEKNREILRKSISASQIQFMNQVHGNHVEVVSDLQRTEPTADAMVTKEKGLALAVMVADCLPILIDGGSVIGAVHVGRKGMSNKIIKNTVVKMKDSGGEDLKATIGPGICGNCYEVEEAMYKDLIKNFPSADGGFRKIDIRRESTQQLIGLGVKVENIEICTLEDEKYYSYRRNNQTGRQCGVISL